METRVGREKLYYIEDRDFSIPELKVIIDALEAASFISEKKTAELIEKVAALSGSHSAELLKEKMVLFNMRKYRKEAVRRTKEQCQSTKRKT